MDPSADGLIGNSIDRYHVECRLGEGGMGIVYKAFDIRLHRLVALKVLRPESVSNLAHLQRFINEARAVSALNHPHICMIHDADEQGGLHYLVLEYIEGETLRVVLQREGKLAPARVIRLGREICAALAAAHAQGIVHRDIKPENIMLSAGGAVKIMDFGLAKLKMDQVMAVAADEAPLRGVPDHVFMTTMSSFLGTAAYMSPEQIEKKTIDERSDLFSLGMVLYECLTGVHPFSGSTPIHLMQAIVQDPPAPLPAGVPGEVVAALERAMAKNPQDRFASAAEMEKALAAAESPDGASARVRSWLAPALLFLLLAVVLLSWFWRGQFPVRPTSIVPLKLQPVGLTMETEEWPSLSPDGRALAYSVKSSSFMQHYLRIRHLDHSDSKNLLRSPVDVIGADWSPDGAFIAYTAVGRGIFVIDTTGSNPRQITETGFIPRWSPDGKFLVFSTNPPAAVGVTNAIHLFSFQTGRQEVISPRNGLKYGWPSWSPDGRWIAAAGGEGSVWEIWLIDVRSHAARALTSKGAWIKNPVWSPDGQSILYISNQIGSNEVWRLPVDPVKGSTAGEAVQITSGADIEELDVSTQSGQIVLTRVNAESEIWRIPLQHAKSSPAKAKHVATLQGSVDNIELSPDRTMLAIELLEKGVRYIILRSLIDSSEFALHDNQNMFAPAWSPDGAWIAYDAGGGNNAEIYRLGSQPSGLTAGRQIRSRQGLVVHPGADWMPVWSPVDQQIVFLSNRSGHFEIWLHDLITQKSSQLTATGAFKTRPAWSHDGKKLAFMQREDDGCTWLCLYDLQHRQLEKIRHIEWLQPDMTHRCRWNAADTDITILSTGERGVFWRITLSNRLLIQDRFLKEGFPFSSRSFDLDGEFGYFIVDKDKKDIWMAEEPL